MNGLTVFNILYVIGAIAYSATTIFFRHLLPAFVWEDPTRTSLVVTGISLTWVMVSLTCTCQVYAQHRKHDLTEEKAGALLSPVVMLAMSVGFVSLATILAWCGHTADVVFWTAVAVNFVGYVVLLDAWRACCAWLTRPKENSDYQTAAAQ